MAVDTSSLALGYPAAAQLQPAIQSSQPVPVVLQSPPATNFHHYLRPQLQKTASTSTKSAKEHGLQINCCRRPFAVVALISFSPCHYFVLLQFDAGDSN
jgi:hypothetical protein